MGCKLFSYSKISFSNSPWIYSCTLFGRSFIMNISDSIGL